MAAKLRAPGWYRSGLYLIIGVLFAAALVTAARAAYGLSQPFGGSWDANWQNAVLIVSLLAAPLFFLGGLGTFDYWLYWASGRPTRPEDHSSHGATSWRRRRAGRASRSRSTCGGRSSPPMPTWRRGTSRASCRRPTQTSPTASSTRSCSI